MIHDTWYMIHDVHDTYTILATWYMYTCIFLIFMLMLMLYLWPKADTPGVTHFGAYHRSPDGHFFTIFDNDEDNTEEEEKESKQVDQMDEMKEGFGHKRSFYTREPPPLADILSNILYLCCQTLLSSDTKALFTPESPLLWQILCQRDDDTTDWTTDTRKITFLSSTDQRLKT